MRFRTIVAVLALLATSVWAQGLRLRPGDEVELAVRIGTREVLRRQTLVVAPDGYLYLPLGGRVRVLGRDESEIRRDLISESQKASQLKRPPQIEFAVRKFVARVDESVSLLGAFAKPGLVVFETGMTMKHALAQVGGFDPELTVREVQLIRGAQVTAMSPQAALTAPRADTTLQTGDLIVAVQEKRPVTVFGVVQKPGPVDWHAGQTVVDAIALAGGFPTGGSSEQGESAQADLSQIKLMRAGTETVVNLTRLVTRGFMPADSPSVEPGDLIYVPTLRDRCTIVGAVLKPGSYQLEPGDRFLDVLGKAQPIVEGLDRRGEAMLRRATGEVLTIPLGPLLEEGKSQHNVALLPNDLIVVPFVGQVAVVGEVRQPGFFPLRERPSAQSLALLAGPTERADLHNVQVVRNGAVLATLAIDPRQPVAASAPGPPLLSGDVILVPPRDGVYVVGAVNFPGLVPPQKPLTLLDALRHARWLSPLADARRATILRARGGRVLNLTPDLEALQRGDRSQNVELQPGDTVVVPFRRTGGGFLSRLDPVFLIGFLAPYIIRP